MNDKFDFSGKTILIVEDDNITRTLYREILKHTGAIVELVKSGYEAYEFFRTNPVPDIVLMDIRLPDVNGLEIARKLLYDNPQLIIVAQTAFANSNMEDECINVGMKGFITKPIQRDLVLKMIQKNLFPYTV
jgi:CheY-like chemotaxis protein